MANETRDSTPAREDALIEARHLYWTGWTIARIADRLGIPYGTLDSRKRRDGWDKVTPIDKAKAALDRRYLQLIAKPEKTDADLAEMDRLGREMERMARIAKFGATGKASDLNPAIKNRNRARAKKKNHIPDAAAVKLLDDFHDRQFTYQRTWNDARVHRIRNILKSRQIGATWYFAREAFADALETGDNQIFLSASKAQAHVSKAYITDWVADIADVDLKGDPIRLQNGGHLYFLSTNSRTAQGYHGHVYSDEYFWIPRFLTLRKVASGMAMHKRWRQTYMSTPSTLGHEAYGFWSGALFNKGRARADQVDIDISHAALKNGFLCADGQWRHMVTVMDAAAGGNDLFDIDALRGEYAPQDFDNLLMCRFVDDARAVFAFKALVACGVDSWEVWDDLAPLADRPYGDRAVWIGYDPSRTRDDASLAVIAPPAVPGGKYRVLETFQWQNIDFEAQANKIRQLRARYNVQRITIDASGIGQGVYELVTQFFPAATRLTYSVEVKSRLVLKAMNLVQHRRLEWDAGQKGIPAAFMTIHKTVTPSGAQTTFRATRTNDTGHADLAWAIMHALNDAPMETAAGGRGAQAGFMELF